jgi:ribosomal protein S18 acetylase RimI-like enzyme
VIAIRPAVASDEAELTQVDLESWSHLSSPSRRPGPSWTFFANDRVQREDVLVALVDGQVAGYVQLARATPLAASDHVRMISGIAVAAGHRRRGVGRALVDAAAAEARARGATRLTLRVLAPNSDARDLYESAGFVVEGTLRGEFVLDGELVDDVLMARSLS